LVLAGYNGFALHFRLHAEWRRIDDDDIYYYIRWRLKLEGETENMGVCTCVNLRLQSALGDHWCYHQVGQASGRTPQADLR
jgi:hypothetical protein